MKIIKGTIVLTTGILIAGCQGLGPNNLMFDSCAEQCTRVGREGSFFYNECTSQPHGRACSWYVTSHKQCLHTTNEASYLSCVYGHMQNHQAKRSAHVNSTLNKLSDDLKKASETSSSRRPVTCVHNGNVTTCH